MSPPMHLLNMLIYDYLLFCDNEGPLNHVIQGLDPWLLALVTHIGLLFWS